jgi:hypothetical protein
MRLAGHVERLRDVYTIVIWKSERKKPLGRPWRRWEDSIWIGLKELECEGVDWVRLAQNGVQRRALVKTVTNTLVPWKVGSSLTSWATVNFLRRTLIHAVCQVVTCSLEYLSPGRASLRDDVMCIVKFVSWKSMFCREVGCGFWSMSNFERAEVS